MRESERRRLYLKAMRAFAEVRDAWARKPSPGTKEWTDMLTLVDEMLAANAAYNRFLNNIESIR